MDEVYANLLNAYGPFAVFLLLLLSGVGIPLGEDVIVIPAGVLVGHDRLDLFSTAVSAYLGVVASDLLWFSICRRYGTPLLHQRWFKRFLHPRRLLEAKHQIERRGTWVIVMSRFMPGSRAPAITMSGMLHLPLWTFAVAECSCALATVPFQLGVGMLIARGVGAENTARLIQTLVGTVMLVLLLLLALGWFGRYRAHHKRFPRARAAWLRRFRKKKVLRD